MQSKRKLIRYVMFCIVVLLIIITPLVNVSITSFQIYFQHLTFEGICYGSGIVIFYFVSKKVLLKWKKAPTNELRTEDSVLLEGVGVLQGTVFIYLSLSEELVSSSLYLNLLRWSIPLAITSFYVLRGYGAVKNSPKHRFYSSLILIFYLVFEVSSFLNEFVSNYFTIYVNSVNIVSLYFPFSANLVPASFIIPIYDALAVRYGYVRK